MQPGIHEDAGALVAFLQPCDTLDSELRVPYSVWALTIDGGHLVQLKQSRQKTRTKVEVHWQSCVSCSQRARRGPDASIGGLLASEARISCRPHTHVNCCGPYSTSQVGDPPAMVITQNMLAHVFPAGPSTSWGFRAHVFQAVLKKLRSSVRNDSFCVGVTVLPA